MRPINHKSCVFFYSDILGYRSLLSEIGVGELHSRIVSSFEDIETLVNREKNSSDYELQQVKIGNNTYSNSDDIGSYDCFLAFDTIIVTKEYNNIIPDWAFIDRFCFFVSLLYLHLFIEYGFLIRGAVGLSSDYRLSRRAFTIDKISRAYELEKAINASCILIDLYEPLQGPFPVTSQEFDPFFWYRLDFKGNQTPAGLARAPIHPIERQAVLNLFNSRTIQHLSDNQMSFMQAYEDLQVNLEHDFHVADVFAKIKNTIRYFDANMRYYNPGLLSRWSRRNLGDGYTPIP